MSTRALRVTILLAVTVLLAFFAAGCDQFMSSALIYLSQNPPNYDKAIEQLNEGLTVVPDNGNYYRELAYCYFNNRQYKEARQAYDNAIKNLPDKKDSLIAAREANWTELYKSAGSYANRIAKAPADSVQFFVDKAQKALDNAVVFMPDNDQNFIMQAFIYLKAGKEAEAKKMYLKVIELNPKNAGAYNTLGIYAYNAGNYAEAAEYYKKAVEINPADTITYSRLGMSYFAANKFAEAVDPFRKAALLDPANRFYLMSWATAIINTGKNLDQAFEPLNKAVKLQEDDEVWKLIGVNALRIPVPDYDQAMTAFRKAIEFKPDLVENWKYLRDIYAVKKMKAEVKEADKKIKELEKK